MSLALFYDLEGNVFADLRLCYRLSNLVEQISKKPIPDHQKNVILEVTCEDATEEDVEVPYVMLKLNK